MQLAFNCCIKSRRDDVWTDYSPTPICLILMNIDILLMLTLMFSVYVQYIAHLFFPRKKDPSSVTLHQVTSFSLKGFLLSFSWPRWRVSDKDVILGCKYILFNYQIHECDFMYTSPVVGNHQKVVVVDVKSLPVQGRMRLQCLVMQKSVLMNIPLIDNRKFRLHLPRICHHYEHLSKNKNLLSKKY